MRLLYRTNLPDLIWFCFSVVFLKIYFFFYSIVSEVMMATPYTFHEAELYQ
jgi:hypothetical protein